MVFLTNNEKLTEEKDMFLLGIGTQTPVIDVGLHFCPSGNQFLLRRLKLHGQNHTKCTQFGPCKKKIFHRLSFLKTEY